MPIHKILLMVSIFTTGLAAGAFFAFTALVVPGLKDASTGDLLKGFQTIDRRLQPNSPSIDWQPVFGMVVFGSAFLLVAVLILGFPHASGIEKLLVTAAATVYNLGFWIPTYTTILPFNNRIRDADIDSMNEQELEKTRQEFERNWGRWHLVRTLSLAVAFGLLIVVFLSLD